MAIEFNCPYCTATVRVGDDASGKIGRCPKCDTRMRIPNISPAGTSSAAPSPQAIPRPQPPAETAPQSDSPFPDFTASAPPANPGQLPVVPVTEDPVTSKYMRKKRRKQSSLAGWFPPLLFGGIFVAIGIAYWQWTQPDYTGSLVAEQLNPNQSIQIQLDGTIFNIDQKVFDQIVNEVRDSPSTVRSNLVNLRFSAGADGLEITLSPGMQAVLVKVPISQHEAVNKFYRNHYDELDDHRLDEMQAGLISLANDWVKAPEGTKNDTLPEYRNNVVYNAFVKGLGRICYARIGNQIYPCIHEDSTGALYFLVPEGTETFSIRERQDLPEHPIFPSEFRIDVTVNRPKPKDAEIVPSTPDTEIPVIETPDESTESTPAMDSTTEEMKLPTL